MIQRESDELKSLEEIQQVFNINVLKIAGIPALVAGKVTLDGFITLLKGKRAIQDADQKGLADNKQNLRNQTRDDVLDVAAALVALGNINNDEQLIQQFNFTKSELDDKRIGDFLSAADDTVVAANANMAALTAQTGLTNTQVNDLALNAANLVVANTTPDQAINVKKAATAVIKVTFPKTRKLTDTLLTPLMRTNFFVADNDFYRIYLESTQIVDTGHHFLDVYGNVFNVATNTLIAKASVKFFNSVTNELVLSVKAGDKGFYRVKQLPEGSYRVEVSHPDVGSATYTLNKIATVNIKQNFGINP